MKKIIVLNVILVYLFVNVGGVFARSSNSFMKVTYIKDDENFAANKGSADGVVLNSIYKISQDGIDIGRAKVVVVKKDVCALKVVEMKSGWSVMKDNHLKIDNSQDAMFYQIENAPSFSKDSLLSGKRNEYYLRGQEKAEEVYGGSGALVGGVVMGTLFGLIGWGVGYAVISSQDIEVPYKYTSTLENEELYSFTSGYKEKLKKKRNSKFNMGAGVGVIAAVIIVASVTSNSK